MCKSAPRTMRFDKDVEEYIEKQKGENFSEKFHAMVRYCRDTEKKRNEIIKRLDREIADREKKLKDLNERISSVAWLERSFRELAEKIGSASKALDNVIQK